MRPTSSLRFLAKRILSAFIAFGMAFGPVTAAYANPTPLADIPIASKVTAKPNIIYTLDDSGSMQFNYLPDYVTATAASVPLTTWKKVGANMQGTLSAANFANIVVGDWIMVTGSTNAEYNGSFQIFSKNPTAPNPANSFTVIPAAAPVFATAGGSPVINISTPYCRSGTTVTPCTPQAMNIVSNGAVQGAFLTLKRTALAAGPTDTVTATGSIAMFASLSTGDTLLITTSNATTIYPTGVNAPSAPFYGPQTITKVNPTTFTYVITNAVPGVTPQTSTGGRFFIDQGAGSAFAAPPLHAADFNRLAYNPAVDYAAPKKSDGTPLTNSGTDANGNYGASLVQWGTPSVDRDPFAAYEVLVHPLVAPMWAVTVKDDLSLKVGVPLYCNTDWPPLVSDSTWVNSASPGASALDAGDANGQYSAGAGSWCRINGTEYAANNGSPAAVADYNYPWQATAATTMGQQYFYQLLGTKRIWCDKTSPYWPRTQSALVGCTLPATYQAPVTEPQFCKPTGGGMACNPSVPLRTYTTTSAPFIACSNSVAFCSPPGTGVTPECEACACDLDTPTTTGVCRRVSNPAVGTGTACSCTGTGCTLPACADQVITAATCTGCPGPVGSCNVYNYTPAASVACNTPLWDTTTNLPSVTATVLSDAGAPNTSGTAPGTTCRHNNYTYAVGGAAGPFKYHNIAPIPTYPGEGAGTGKFDQPATTSCPLVGTTVQIPRHYYVVDSVQFCDTRETTANLQWRGFGKGNCQAKNDLGHFKEIQYGKFTRVDVFANNTFAFPGSANFAVSTTPYPKGPPSNPSKRDFLAASGPVGTLGCRTTTSPCPENSEAINYANWYAYYSTRLNAGKSTSATAFSFLTNVAPDPIAYRVGFHDLGEEPVSQGGGGTPIIYLDVADWDQTQRDAWYNQLFGITVSNYKTPISSAMLRIGHLLENKGVNALPANINPIPAAQDIIAKKPDNSLISCQNNYHILFTDGKNYQAALPTVAGEQDANVPASLDLIPKIAPDYVLEVLAPLSATSAVWPTPFVQGTPAISDTLSDIASYYWTRDLRSDLQNDVPASSSKKPAKICLDPVNFPCPPAALIDPPGVVPNDLDYRKDVAWWQHMNFSAISFGAEGTLDATDQPTTITGLTNATLKWPDLTQPNNPVNPKGAGAGAVAVDDLWHATVMSRGSFVFARSPIEVSYGISSILAGIQNQRKSRAGAAFGGAVLNAANNIIFEPTIEPGWAGDLLKVQIDPTDGSEVKTWWQAGATLAAQIAPIIATNEWERWMDPAVRRIVTLTGSTGPGIPFQYANLSGAQLASLAPTAIEQQKMISYLRGGTTFGKTTAANGTVIEGTSIGQYRKRFGALGDLSNAQPVIVFNPGRPYKDITDPGYTAYRTAHASRPARVVAPANDGMVHVFAAGPMPGETSPPVNLPGGGNEVFAFIPKALFKGAAGTPTEDPSGIQALANQDGGVPIYRHHMYVDSSPRAADVDFGGPDWRTIVVGGLGKGGNSYYALDLTADADPVNEAGAANKVLWEWSDPEVKYSYGRPVIVKVRDSGYPYGRWVVMVTGGYDNASGLGKIFILDAKTGLLLRTITTTAGAPPGAGLPTIPSTASGLAQIHAFVKNQGNQIAEQIYGGDLLGNVWRVDVSVPDSYLTAPAVLFAELVDPSGAAQPVTVAPQIEIDISNGIDRYVFIGTGRLLDTTDLTTPVNAQTQTMYAIRDGTLQTPSTTGLPIQTTRGATPLKPINLDGISAIAGGAPDGWYHDLPNTATDSQRIVVDPQSNLNVAAYVGTKVQDDPCVISLPAVLYARDYTTAESLVEDSSGNVQIGLDFPGGLVDIATVGMIQSDGTQVIGVLGSQEIPGTKPAKITNKFTGLGQRLSWKLLGGE